MDKTMKFFQDNKDQCPIAADGDKYLKSLKDWYTRVYKSLSKNIDKVRENISGRNKQKEEKEAETLSKWMEKTLYGKSSKLELKNIAMLSSHDAGSYTMKPEYYAASLLGKAAQTQKLNFMGQLRSGVRHFDFRMRLSNSVPVFCHGIINGAPVTEAIQQITKFINSHGKEVIILQIKADEACFKKFYELPCVKELAKYIYYDVNNPSKYHGKDIRIDDVGSITFDDVIAAGKNVLILKKGQTVSKFHEDVRTKHDAEEIATTELKDLENKQNNNKFHKITPIDTAKITDFLAKDGKWVPLKNAARNSNKIYEKLMGSQKFKELANLIGVDAAGSDDCLNLAKKVVEINEERIKNHKKDD